MQTWKNRHNFNFHPSPCIWECVCVCVFPPTGQSEYQEVALICICWLSYACVLTLTSHKWSLFCRESVYLALVHDKNRNVIRCINCKCIVHNWIFEHVSKQWGNLILIIQFTFFFFPERKGHAYLGFISTAIFTWQNLLLSLKWCCFSPWCLSVMRVGKADRTTSV